MFPQNQILQTLLLSAFLDSEEISQETKTAITGRALEKYREMSMPQNQVCRTIADQVRELSQQTSVINSRASMLNGLSHNQILKARSMGYESLTHAQESGNDLFRK